MNFTKSILSIALFGLFFGSFTSCTQETVTPDNLESSNLNLEQLRDDYIAKHGQDVVVEYTSLEALNEVFTENGLPTFTLEDIGSTEEEYAAAQARIQSTNVADLRCDNVDFYNILCDINGNGTLTTWDVLLANRVILGTDPATPESDLFGFISEFHVDADPALTSALTAADLTLAIRVVLFLPC